MIHNKTINLILTISLLAYLTPLHAAQDVPKKPNLLQRLRSHQVVPQKKSQAKIEEEIRATFAPIYQILPLVLEYVENEFMDKQSIIYHLPKEIDPALMGQVRAGFFGNEEIIRIDFADSNLLNIITTKERQLTITPDGMLKAERLVKFDETLVQSAPYGISFEKQTKAYELIHWVHNNYIKNEAISPDQRFKAVVIDKTLQKRRHSGDYLLFGYKSHPLHFNPSNYGVELRKEVKIYPSRRELLRKILGLPEHSIGDDQHG